LDRKRENKNYTEAKKTDLIIHYRSTYASKHLLNNLMNNNLMANNLHHDLSIIHNT